MRDLTTPQQPTAPTRAGKPDRRDPRRYDASSREWEYINPDGTPDEDMLRRVTDAVVEAVSPLKVILFGSAARREMTAGSDIDLLVVKDNCHRRRTARKIHAAVPGNARGVDVVVASTKDVERNRHQKYTVIEPAMREGRVLYLRTEP